MKSVFFFIAILSLLSSCALNASNDKITIKIADYDYTDGFAEIRKIGNTQLKYLGGDGGVGYQFDVKKTGWYSVFLFSAPWATNIFIDEKLLTLTSLVDFQKPSKQSSSDKLKKILNVFLEKGTHMIGFDHSWAAGLPWLREIVIKPASRMADMVSVEIIKNRAVYSQDEAVTLEFVVAKHSGSYAININVSDEVSGEVVDEGVVISEKGVGNQKIPYTLPSSKSGVFRVDFIDDLNQKVVKSFQYVVVQKTIISDVVNERKTLIATIDAVKQEPDYSSSATAVVVGSGGSYRESQGIGYYNDKSNPDYFSYILDTPENDQLYMAEITFPDDKKRTFTASVVDSKANPYAIDAGVMTGREFPLSMREKKLQIYFYSKDKQQRLLFFNWHSGEKIAIKKVSLFEVENLSQQQILVHNHRYNAMYFEEPMRFATYFGADTGVKDWVNIKKAATRWAEWSRSNYVNHWIFSVAGYQGRMWPTNLLPGYAPGDTWSAGMLGDSSNKDIIEKDILWLLLLVAEQYDIKVTFELQIAPNKAMLNYLADQWRSAPDDIADGYKIVSKHGETGTLSAHKPYFNPVNHNVQKWTEAIFSDLVNRYHTLTAFNGISIRLMRWSFAGWQAFPSMDWGYGDYTINMFEKETNIIVPISPVEIDRYMKRYKWLMKNAYNEWVSWRTDKIYQYHKNLQNILLSKRKDLNLTLGVFNPTYATVDSVNKKKLSSLNHIKDIVEYNSKGWKKLLKETGIDVFKYADNQSLLLAPVARYPSGIKVNKIGPFADYRIAAMMDGAVDKEKIKSTLKSDGVGYESSIIFYNEYMESNFDTHNIGLDLLRNKNKKRSNLSICGVLNPAGRNMLARYADALAEGNVTSLADGGLGYILGQPHITKEFMREYMSIPAISMNRHKDTGDAVSLWYGFEQNDLFFYVVNRADYPVQINIKLSKNSKVSHITTGDVYSGAILNLSLKPYEIQAFQSNESDVSVVNVKTNYPAEVAVDLESQIYQARDIINRLKASPYNNKFIKEIQVAEQKLADVKKKYVEQQYFKAKKGLMSRQLVRVYAVKYTSKSTFPKGLWFD